jgi:uncharacterized protein YecE (DUF72 family)
VSQLWLGTSSWQFDAWRGVFYPDDVRKDRYLEYYATQFNSVEVNTSFYGLPAPATLIRWVEAVGDDFTFALKCPRSITHEKRLVDCERETREYLEVLRSLGSAAAPGFVQLPPNFTRARDGRALAAYLDWLPGELGKLRLAVEVRAADLMTAAFVQFVIERGLGFVLVDREGTPDLYEMWKDITFPRDDTFLFVRWIGDDRNGPKGDREITAPRDTDLDRWAARIRECLDRGIDVYGYFHNPYEGHSPASVRRLYERLGLPEGPRRESRGGTDAEPDADESAQMPLF